MSELPVILAQSALGQGASVVQLSTLQFGVALLVAVTTMLVPIVVVVRWLVGLKGDIDVARAQQRGHEDVCEQRYQQIAANFATLVRTSDQRHEENKDRLEEINHRQERMDAKMDRLIEGRGHARP